MKNFLLPLLAFALSATAASAQMSPGQDGGRPQRTPEEMASRQTQGLTKQLGLSADQSAKVQQIMLARDQEMTAMRGQMQAGTGDRKQMRDQAKTGRIKYDEQIRAVLTPDQLAKYNTMQTNRRERGMEMKESKMKKKDGKVKIKA
ncbi:hypothetical protein GCM10027422_19930 [Hymenobacter arcticus]